MLKMRTISLFLFLITSFTAPLFAASGSDYGRFSDREEENALNIGIPDFPRRIRKELPETKKETGIQAGIVRLHPSFSTSFELDDNIKLGDGQREKEITDGIFTQRPGLAAEMKLGNHRVEGGYGMEIQNYAKDQEENTINHLAYGLAELNFDELTFLIEDNFEKSTNRLFSETSSRDHLRLNEVHVLARYDRPRWASEIGWTHNTVDHLTPGLDLNNYNEDILALLGGYKILPKTLLLTEFDWGTVYYDQKTASADQNYFQLLGGVRGEPRENLALTVKAGFQNRQLDDVQNEGPQTDFVGFVMNSDIVYKLTEGDTARAGYVRTVKTSTFSTSSYYREDKIYFSYNKRFFTKWYLMPQTSWQMNEYPEAAAVGSETLRRRDHFWQAGIGLRYKIQEWMWMGIAYNFRTRNSNFNSLDYDNNRMTVDLSFLY